MAVALYGKGFGHFHRAYFGNAPNVVAGQVNQHDVLGALFGIVDQFEFGCFVFFGRCAAGSCASQGPNGHFHTFFGLLLAHQNFWAGSHNVEVAKVVEVHVGAGVE
jgi:hypothetical protein